MIADFNILGALTDAVYWVGLQQENVEGGLLKSVDTAIVASTLEVDCVSLEALDDRGIAHAEGELASHQ